MHGFIYLCTGAIKWRQEWSKLQASTLWGYMSVQQGPFAVNGGMGTGMGDGNNDALNNDFNTNPVETAAEKYWSLDPVSGPERVPLRLKQEYDSVTVKSETKNDKRNGNQNKKQSIEKSDQSNERDQRQDGSNGNDSSASLNSDGLR